MTKTLGIRLDDETEALLDSLSETMNLKKSQLMKQAFNEWAVIKQSLQAENKILCDRILLAHLFRLIPEDAISEIAETMSEHIISIIKIRQIENNLEESIEMFLQNYTTFSSLERSGWFQNIDYTVDEGGKVSIYGIHSLNHQYSRYASELISRILLKKFNYVQKEGRTTDNSIILEFIKG
jgi:hypothetical protein